MKVLTRMSEVIAALGGTGHESKKAFGWSAMKQDVVGIPVTYAVYEECRTSQDKYVALFSPYDHAAIEQHIDDNDSYHGTSCIVLTKADIEAMRAGKILVWAQGEYSSIIVFEDE